MLIVCPNCQTYYSVDRRGFEPSGRMVRCHHCGNSWRQGPVAENAGPAAAGPAPARPAQPYPAPPPPPQGYAPYPPPGYAPYPPPGYAPYPTDPNAAYAAQQPPQQAAQQAAAPAAAPPAPQPEPSPPDEPVDVVEPNFDLPDPEEEDDLDDAMAANIDELFSDDDEDEGVTEAEAETETEDAAEQPIPDETGNDDLSDEDIDGLFDDDDDTGGISSMIDSGDSDTGIDDLDDIPEPEPLPQSLTGGIDDDDEDDEVPVGRIPSRQKKKKGKTGLIAALVVLFFLIATGVVGFFARALIVDVVPESQMVYDLIGIDTGILGEGLEIQNVQSSRATEAGIDILLVRGTIMNVVNESAPVPLVQAILLDADGVELQSVVQEPGQTELATGNSIDFTIRIDEPSPLSRRMEVTFAPRGGEEG